MVDQSANHSIMLYTCQPYWLAALFVLLLRDVWAASWLVGLTVLHHVNVLLCCGGKVWSRYEEPKEEVVQENEVLERKISYKTVVVTEITSEMHFYAQNTETGESL